jgi:hypothetical protein
VRCAVDLGINPMMAEHLAENAKPNAPQFSTLAFGGKCLQKDRWMWDAASGSMYGETVLLNNRRGPSKALKTADSAITLLGLPLRSWTILGLQDGPSSGECSHSPALLMSTLKKWIDEPLFVDTSKPVREHFKWLLEKKQVTRARVATPDDRFNTNVVIIAQKSHGPAIYNALIKILQGSEEPIKVVVNACNMSLTDQQVIEALKWGAVFVDQQELDRMLRERDAANKAALVTAMIS